MKVKIVIVIIFVVILPLLMGYLPGNWTSEYAKDDIEKSDMVAIVRVISLQTDEESVFKEKGLEDKWHDTICRSYSAELLLLSCIKPDTDKKLKFQPGSRFRMDVGYDLVDLSKNSLALKPASPALRMHNTQNGLDLRIGQTYLMFLAKNTSGKYPFSPRSGPHSIYWFLPNDQYRRKDNRDYGEIKTGFNQLLTDIKKKMESAQPSD